MDFLYALLKGFVDLFASGISDVKVILFVLFLTGFWSLSFLRKKEASNNKYIIIFIIFLGITFIYGLFLHVFILNKYDLSLNGKIMYFSENEITSSEILHTHELKSSFTIINSSFNDGIDNGAGTSVFLPKIFVYTGFLLFLINLALFILTILKSDFKTKKELFLYCFLLFILFKNAFDGGIFNYEVLAVFLFLLLNSVYKNKYQKVKIGLFLGLLLVAPFYFYGLKFFQTLVFLLCLQYLLFGINKNKKILSAIIILGLTLLNTLPLIIYQNTIPLNKDGLYLSSFFSDQDFEIVYRVGEMYMYKTQDMKIKDIIEKHSLVVTRRPVRMEWKDCRPNKYKDYSFTIYSEKKPLELTLKKEDNLQLFLTPNDHLKYGGYVTVKDCMASNINNQIQESLRELDLLPALMFDFEGIEPHLYN